MKGKKYKKKISLILGGLVFLVLILFVVAYLGVEKETSLLAPETTETEEHNVPLKYDDIYAKTTEEREGDGQHVLHASWPATENETINADLDQFGQEFIEEFRLVVDAIKADQGEFEGEPDRGSVIFHADYRMHFDVSFANDDYIAFVFSTYRNTGNTGTDDVLSVIYDRKTGERIPISSLFVDDNYLEMLSRLSRENLYKELEREADTLEFSSEAEKQEWIRSQKENTIDVGTAPTEENFHSVVINEESEMVISFDKYQVASGYQGIMSIAVPIRDIYHALAPAVREALEQSKEDTSLAPEETVDATPADPEVVPPSPSAEGDVDCSRVRCIAFTFDDGPSLYTDKLLDTLIEKDVRATFFVLGVNAKVQQRTLKRIADAGMEIGNHTRNHPDLTRLSDAEIKTNSQKQLI